MIGLQAHRRYKHQPVTAGPTNTRDNQMAKGKGKNVTNRNQGNMAPSTSPTIASPGYPNTPEEQDLNLKSHGMMLIGFQEEHNNSLKDVQEKPGGGGARL